MRETFGFSWRQTKPRENLWWGLSLIFLETLCGHLFLKLPSGSEGEGVVGDMSLPQGGSEEGSIGLLNSQILPNWPEVSPAPYQGVKIQAHFSGSLGRKLSSFWPGHRKGASYHHYSPRTIVYGISSAGLLKLKNSFLSLCVTLTILSDREYSLILLPWRMARGWKGVIRNEKHIG